MPRRPPLVIGHRGGPGYRPEHTRSSYDLAIELGVDAVEPDVVVSRDGVLVVRHENEIGSTTDVSTRPEFAARRTTKVVDGVKLEGWFAEDFDWAELATLRGRERLPKVRPASASFDDRQPILSLRDVLDLVAEGSVAQGREIGAVVEIKHATYFAALGWDVAALLTDELHAAGWGKGRHPLVVESFELGVIDRVRASGVTASTVFLMERAGRPFDSPREYGWFSSPEGLDSLVGRVDGVSLDRRMILAADPSAPGGRSAVVDEAHARGLTVFAWTCRAENAFLLPPFRGRGGKSAFGDYEGEWAVLREAGVDGVFVDQPDLGVAVFRGLTPA